MGQKSMLLDILQDPQFATADTPTFIYFEEIIAQNLQDFCDLTHAIPNRKCMYSTKAATFPFLLNLFYQHGISAFDASSVTEAQFIYELFGHRIELYVTAPAIHEKEFAILEKIQPTCVHLDSLDSIEKCLAGDWTFPLGVRLNPGIGYSRVELHEAGGERSRLGLPLALLDKAMVLFKKYGREEIGLHFHVSCEAESFEMQTAAVQRITEYLATIPQDNLKMTHLDIGGGLLPPLWDFTTDTFQQRVKRESMQDLVVALKNCQCRHENWLKDNFQVLHEPGDFLTAATAILVSKVLEERQSPMGRSHLMLDTNINHFPNVLHYRNTPLSLTWPMLKADDKTREVLISGNSCLGGDNILTMSINAEQSPDYIIFTERGSYEYTQLNFFNGRFRPAVYLLKQDNRLVRIKKDNIQNLLAYWHEDVADFPESYQSFHELEKIVNREIGIRLYHPEMRHISSFELDSTDFPVPNGLKNTMIEQFDTSSMRYGRSLGTEVVREHIAMYENQVVAKPNFFTAAHCASTLGATNGIWL
jgi:diaminopimelate decarboxylase